MTAARPDETRSNGASVLGAGRGRGEAKIKVSRIEVELSVARPLATLQLWSRMVTSGLNLDWQPDRTMPRTHADWILDLGDAGSVESRPLEPGIPYAWADPGPLHEIKQEQAQLVLEVELAR